MGQRDSGSLFPQQPFDLQQRKSNPSIPPVYPRLQHAFPALISSDTDTISANRAFSYAVRPPHSCMEGGSNELHGWLYGMARFRHGFGPALIPGTEEPAFTTTPCKNHDVPTGSGGAQKRFLVFDHSGDQTTLIFSSGIGTYRGLKRPNAFDFNRDVLRQTSTKTDLDVGLGGINANEFDENSGPNMQSEMREDTEELNALLYSDDDESDYPEDDEVTSTGHSPSTMTCHDKQELCEGSTGGAASFNLLPKKRKLPDDCNDQVLDAKMKQNELGPEYVDDAESSCASAAGPASDSPLGNKRIRREKIRETVSLLRSIVPCGEEKDPALILDEAIDYLKSLKRKAKSLGIDSL